jgi:putative spermidine/putrescine transport system substrate-binding protein
VFRHRHRLSFGDFPAASRASLLALTVAASICAWPNLGLAQDTLNVATWGGAYGQSQEIAFFEPFAKETGISVATEIYDGNLGKLKRMIGGDGAAVDVVDISASALDILCKQGLLETISTSSLGAAPSGGSVEEDFFSGALSSCGARPSSR